MSRPAGTIDNRRHPPSFFAFHGPWAPGVRLFRRVDFRRKALLVSAFFMLPLLLLGAYLRNVQADLATSRAERAGVQILRAAEPWLIEVQRQRRLVLSGMAARPDFDGSTRSRGRWRPSWPPNPRASTLPKRSPPLP